MNAYQIKTHQKGKSYQAPHFFILNKGLNSGKPLAKPCVNCFVCLTKKDNDKEFMYWLCFGLWRSKSFQFFLRGSVIPFITIHDTKKHLQASAQTANNNLDLFQKSIEILKGLEKHEQTLNTSLKLIETARIAVFHKLMLR